MGAVHYRRAQHDARISVGASANNLILHGLLCSRSSVLRVGLLCITAKVRFIGKVPPWLRCREERRASNTWCSPSTWYSGWVWSGRVYYDREIQPTHTVNGLRCVCVKEEAKARCVRARIRREQVSEWTYNVPDAESYRALTRTASDFFIPVYSEALLATIKHINTQRPSACGDWEGRKNNPQWPSDPVPDYTGVCAHGILIKI